MGRNNIDLDERLVRRGLRIFNWKSKRELLRLALKELLRSAKRKEILELRGKVKWKGDLEKQEVGKGAFALDAFVERGDVSHMFPSDMVRRWEVVPSTMIPVADY